MIQLRIRSEFSFKTAFGPIVRLANSLKNLGVTHAGLVDNGTWGHVKWAAACEKAGVIPLFGSEIIVPQPDGRRPVCWVLAEDTRALYRLTTTTRQPEADVLSLLREAKGVIRFSGAALTDPSCFDFVDINPASQLQQAASLALAKKTGKPIVVTSDNYYPLVTDRSPFIAMGGRERGTPQHILTLPEARATLKPLLTTKQWDAALANLAEIAARCATKLPKAPLIKVDGDLRKVVEKGRKSRLKRGHLPSWPAAYAARLKREIEAIEAKEYQSYFLVVADLINWAKARMLVGPGRGSSAGSLLCYLVGITEVDPIPNDLLFERFIDLTRKDLPDIDIDFNHNKREQVFAYLAEKYGKANVARIGNINTLKAKSALNEVCRRFSIPDHEKFELINVLVEYSSGDSRYGKGIEDTLASTQQGQKFKEKYPEAMVVTDLENHASHAGVHAAGVIVSMEPVSDYCTVGADGIAQIDKPDAETLNLLKIDALGLTTLGVIEDAGVVSAEELYALKRDDPKVLKIFNDHKFTSIFQFEGAAQRQVSSQVNIDSFLTIDHVTALARPGPLGGGASNKYIARKAGREEVEFLHPLLKDVLQDTYGVVLYQEQVMSIVRNMGKFSWEDTTTIRKAMSGRKGREFFDQKGELFVKGAAEDKVPKGLAQEIWNQMCDFGAWGMNRCVAFDTLVLLAHPNQFDSRGVTIEELYRRYVAEPSDWIRQRRLMPRLLSLGPDGRARPTFAKDIIKTGKKMCVRLTFEDGRFIDCTADHKFIIDGTWSRCGDAKKGAEFANVKRDRSSTSTAIVPGKKGWAKGRAWKDGERPRLNRKTTHRDEFRATMFGLACEEKGCAKTGQEVHHNDFVGGNKRPKDLTWLCSGHHKLRHKERRGPYARGHQLTAPAILKSIKKLGMRETYDIEMPDPNHNFVLANGIVTHNSHTCSYAVISYWCAWMKCYFPLEYAAACLREKDDDDAIAVLREMTEEGISYVPFDVDRSDINWAVVDGALIGGFVNLVGVGPAKAKKALEDRAAGKLDREKYMAMPVKYADLYPLKTKYREWYNDPESKGCAEGTQILTSPEFPNAGDIVYIGKIVEKKPFDFNEDRRIARRGGKVYQGNTQAIDFKTKDDYGETILCRVDRFNWDAFGRPANEALSTGDEILVRGRRVPGFSVINVDKMMCLNKPDLMWSAAPRRRWN